MNALNDVADRCEAGLPWRSVWPALHGACQPNEPGYPVRLGEVFAALRDAFDVRHQSSLAPVMKHSYKDSPEGFIATLRSVEPRASDAV
jgi:hypothetical protein